MGHKLGWVLAVLALSTTVHAVSAGGIAGYVKDSSGTPQIGAVVEVFTSAATIGTTVFTDAQGHYSAQNLEPGVYQVRVTAASFLPALRENVNLRAGAHLVVNLTLNTLADVMNALPQRRGPNHDADDWHWALKSAANRPVLRVLPRSGPTLVAENDADHDMKAQVALIAGPDAQGFGGNGDVTTAFSLEKSVFATDTVALNGNIGASSGQPSGVLRASYSHDFGNSARPRFALTYRHFAAPGSTVPNSPYSALAMSTSDGMTIGELIDLDYGADVESVDFARRITAFRPFASARVHVSPKMVVEYRYATALPDARQDKGFETAPADMTESGPRMALLNGMPNVERSRHHEWTISRKMGDISVQAGYYADSFRNLILTGAGDPSAYSDDVLPDVYSGTFSYASGLGTEMHGARVVVARKIGDNLTVTADYSNGDSVIADRNATWKNLPGHVRTEWRQSAGAKCSGMLARTGTRWAASYKWTSQDVLTAIDAFNASPGQMDAFLSFLVRQPLPSTSFIPAKMEAVVDVRNLLAQGYVPVLGQDGRTVYLVQSARAVRGGLAFTF